MKGKQPYLGDLLTMVINHVSKSWEPILQVWWLWFLGFSWQGFNLSTRGWIHGTHQTGSSENHRLKHAIFEGYVNSLEGNLKP